jgi:hypothetical protein
MPKGFRIQIDDVRLFPIQAFFNAISDHSFVETIANLLSGVGASFDEAHCEFPADLDPDEEPFEGVRFALYDDEVVVDLQTFRHYLELACIAYISENPSNLPKIETLMQNAILSSFKDGQSAVQEQLYP